jgi:dihydrolipoamide dehydrogenase
MPDSNVYDLAVLGSGPGGYVAAIRAGQLGLKTVVVEKEDLFGGTCLHVGCIPTKALLYTAELLDTLKNAKQFGVIVEQAELDWKGLQKRKQRIVRKLAGGIGYLFKKNGVETLQGFGSLAGEGKLEVRGKEGVKTVEAKNIIIATGSEPRSLPGIEIDGRAVLSNEEILSLPEKPESLAVIGAGAVGVEFASMFASFGAKVTLYEILPRVLPLEDEEISSSLEKALRKRGIVSLVGTRVESIMNNVETVEIASTLPDGSSDVRKVDKLLVAVGRRPRTEGIGLENAGVKTEKGMIPVDEFMEAVPESGIYAIGDVVASQQLAHVASAEGILAVEKIAGLEVRPMNYNRMPSCTYCAPEVASVGLSEAQAKEQDFEVKVGRFPFSANSKASIIGESDGFVKVVSEARYGELLGVHIIGPHATNMIAEACVALEHEATAESLMRVVHPHPTLSEAVMEAAHGTLGHTIHF